MARIPLATNVTADGNTARILITGAQTDRYGKARVVLTGVFDGASVSVRGSLDDTDDADKVFKTGDLAEGITEPCGIDIRLPNNDNDNVHAFLAVSGAGGSTNINGYIFG